MGALFPALYLYNFIYKIYNSSVHHCTARTAAVYRVLVAHNVKGLVSVTASFFNAISVQ